MLAMNSPAQALEIGNSPNATLCKTTTLAKNRQGNHGCNGALALGRRHDLLPANVSRGEIKCARSIATDAGAWFFSKITNA
jgi:hypothetical protein